MSTQAISPGKLAIQLAVYFAILFAVIMTLLQARPETLRFLPFGGTNAFSEADFTGLLDSLPGDGSKTEASENAPNSTTASPESVRRISFFVLGHLSGTIILMVPITWTYRAMNFGIGFSKTFLRALIVLPICATTVVLLIQDSLPLAFGLAALVAAVRFRVTLDEAMDGIFIFAAVCVGLAAGIGYLGVAYLMSVFFCFANLILWAVDYGRNPYDQKKRDKKRDKLVSAESLK